MKFAAIDIGSNGARLLISRASVQQGASEGEISLKNVEYVRFPLRLGVDVFQNKKITDFKKNQLLKLMHAFKLLMDLHEVDDAMVLATSAFREAKNGEEVVTFIKNEIGLSIEVIDGIREAEILNRVIIQYLNPKQNYLHIDVGGGSTELNLYNGVNKVMCHTFPVGTIRNSESPKILKSFKEVKHWIRNNIAQYCPDKEIVAVGTGGNINKIFNLINNKTTFISRQEIQILQEHLNHFSVEELINVFKLNPDRADTILPASAIYLKTMEWADAQRMIVPKVGLKDGMMDMMVERSLPKPSE